MSTTKKLSVGIIGGSGYTGGELIRILVNHPKVSIDFVYSTTRANTHISDTHQDSSSHHKKRGANGHVSGFC